uniref:Uncharacterized protein n=1 Tax=Sus scrofa TaxID=9823 RepID=A0A4X1VT42_PIG
MPPEQRMAWGRQRLPWLLVNRPRPLEKQEEGGGGHTEGSKRKAAAWTQRAALRDSSRLYYSGLAGKRALFSLLTLIHSVYTRV